MNFKKSLHMLHLVEIVKNICLCVVYVLSDLSFLYVFLGKYEIVGNQVFGVNTEFL